MQNRRSIRPPRYRRSRPYQVLAAGLLAALAACSDAQTDSAQFATATARIGPLVDTVLATGTVQTVQSVEVSSQLSGRIEAVFVDFNDIVTEGQPLARLDPQRFRSRVEELKAALALAEADLASVSARLSGATAEFDEADRDWNRKSVLVEKGSVSRSQADRAETALRQAEASLQMLKAEQRTKEAAITAARASLQQAEIDLDRTVIKAPIDGIVIKRSIEPGQTVAASLEAPELFVIADKLDQIEIHASIDEADIGKVRAGQPVGFRVDAFPAQRFSGDVIQIRKAPRINQSVVTYAVLIRAENPDEILLPGMTAIVEIVTAKLDDVLVVPNAALRFSLDATVAASQPGRGMLWKLDGDDPQPIAVDIGYSDEEFTQIRSGDIDSGDSVIIGYRR